MFNLFKRKLVFPDFSVLKAYSDKDSYFVRTAEWILVDHDDIVVIDNYSPRILTFGPWPKMVFIGANGVLTVSEYIFEMAGKYSGKIPEELDQTVIDEINLLLEYKVIKLTHIKARPEKRYDLPRSKKNS